MSVRERRRNGNGVSVQGWGSGGAADECARGECARLCKVCGPDSAQAVQGGGVRPGAGAVRGG